MNSSPTATTATTGWILEIRGLVFSIGMTLPSGCDLVAVFRFVLLGVGVGARGGGGWF